MSEDITRCRGERDDKICPMRENCLRYNQPTGIIPLYFMIAPFDENISKCEFYLETKE